MCVWKDAPAELVYAFAIVTSIANAPYKSAQAAIMPTLADAERADRHERRVQHRGEPRVLPRSGRRRPPARGDRRRRRLRSRGGDVRDRVARHSPDDVPRTEASKEVEASTIVSECMAGFRVVFQHKELRVLMGLFTAQTLVAGLMLVFLVVVAIELLDLGDAGVGYLNSAFGVGALVGAIGALGLTGARRLSPGFLFGLLLWGLPLAVLGFWSDYLAACPLRDRRRRQLARGRRRLHAGPASRAGRSARTGVRRASSSTCSPRSVSEACSRPC